MGTGGVLERTIDRVHTKLTDKAVARLTATASYRNAREFVALVDSCITQLNNAANIPAEVAGLVSDSTLEALALTVLGFRHGDVETAVNSLVNAWGTYVETLSGVQVHPLKKLTAKGRGRGRLLTTEADRQALATYHAAVLALVTDRLGDGRAPQIIRRLMAHLELGYDDLGRMLGVSGETIRRWERAEVNVPSERLAFLTKADAALTKLLGLFRPERLPIVVRRSAKAFAGERALDWILRGRIEEVADRYDLDLSYQA